MAGISKQTHLQRQVQRLLLLLLARQVQLKEKSGAHNSVKQSTHLSNLRLQSNKPPHIYCVNATSNDVVTVLLDCHETLQKFN
jgi:hypothetical protein